MQGRFKNTKRLEGEGFVYFHPSFYVSLLLLLRRRHKCILNQKTCWNHLQTSKLAFVSPRE